MWDDAVLCNALKLKDQIEKGECLPEDLKRELAKRAIVRNDEKNIVMTERTLDRKRNRIK